MLVPSPLLRGSAAVGVGAHLVSPVCFVCLPSSFLNTNPGPPQSPGHRMVQGITEEPEKYRLRDLRCRGPSLGRQPEQWTLSSQGHGSGGRVRTDLAPVSLPSSSRDPSPPMSGLLRDRTVLCL